MWMLPSTHLLQTRSQSSPSPSLGPAEMRPPLGGCAGVVTQLCTGDTLCCTPPWLLSTWTFPSVAGFLASFCASSAETASLGTAPWADPHMYLSQHLLNGCLTLPAQSQLQPQRTLWSGTASLEAAGSHGPLQLPFSGQQAPCRSSWSFEESPATTEGVHRSTSTTQKTHSKLLRMLPASVNFVLPWHSCSFNFF